jgi:N-acetyl-alpha-D-muramate 1-phosphate uridylyltransferase
MSTAIPSCAMVMAAGLGTRMRPLTERIPKPLVQVAGYTLIDRMLDWLARSGVQEAVVNSHYLAPLLHQHLAVRTAPHIHLSHEEEVLETGGGVLNALPVLEAQQPGGPWVVANSDVVIIDGVTLTLPRMAAAWDDEQMDALLLLQPVASAVGYDGVGDFFLEPDGSLRRRGDAPHAPYVFTGIQLLHPRLFAQAPQGKFSLNLLYNAHMPRIRGLVHEGAWLHVGDPAGIAAAEQWLRERNLP